VTTVFAKPENTKPKEDITELDIVDFKNIKKLLVNDRLDQSAQEKKQAIAKRVDAKKGKKRSLYDFPSEKEFWKLISEYWLVKNAALLEWDFVKTDYGIEEHFGDLLHKLGYFGVKYNILILNTPTLTHAALPYGDEYLFLISLPFMRTMDLSKSEISLLLFEDMIRIRMNYFKEKVEIKDLKNLYGKNFAKKEGVAEYLKKMASNYSKILLEDGFSFNEQFKVTQEVDLLLKKDLILWNGYLQLIKKINDLVDNNSLYEKYSRIYPSPKLQLNWLTPKEKNTY